MSNPMVDRLSKIPFQGKQGLTSMKGKIQKYLPYFILLVLSVITLALQNEQVGFEPGHHGWMTSHSLAHISHADFDS
jgi:hypothetical protein